MKVLLVEDHIVLQEGVKHYIESNIKDSEVFTSNSGSKAYKVFLREKFDIIITDLNLPGLNGIELIKKIKSLEHNCKIVVLTMYYNKKIVNSLKKLKINAFLTKNVSLKEVVLAFEHIDQNKTYITPEISNLYYNSLILSEDEIILNDAFSKTYNLSNREIEVIDLMIENHSNDVIADNLFLSIETIKTHRKNIFRKLGVNNLLDLYKLLISSNYIKN